MHLYMKAHRCRQYKFKNTKYARKTFIMAVRLFMDAGVTEKDSTYAVKVQLILHLAR